MEQGNWIQQLTERMDLMGEPVPGQPILELAGERRVLIEHHKGITQYSPDAICVKVCYGWLRVEGCGLSICRMTKQQLIISGEIHAISVLRR